VNTSQPSLLLKGVFCGFLYLRAPPLDRLQLTSTSTAHNGNGLRARGSAQQLLKYTL
jgi:hypothetical protein